MTCHNCRFECRKFGKTRNGQQGYRCCRCYKTYSEPRNEQVTLTLRPAQADPWSVNSAPRRAGAGVNLKVGAKSVARPRHAVIQRLVPGTGSRGEFYVAQSAS